MKKIDDNLLSIFNCMFNNREDWKYITEDQKEKYLFIVTRLMSKKYPGKAQLLNSKSIDKVSAMDTWFIFASSIPYPKWFWSKSIITKNKSEISESEVSYLISEFDILREDLDMILKYYPELVKEELSYYKDVKKQDK